MLPIVMIQAKAWAKPLRQRLKRGWFQPERLEQAPQPVVEVEAERHLRQDVEQRHVPDAEAGDHVVVDVPLDEAGVERRRR